MTNSADSHTIYSSSVLQPVLQRILKLALDSVKCDRRLGKVYSWSDTAQVACLIRG